jgi:formamidopyrimidine-DNA glycosylase
VRRRYATVFLMPELPEVETVVRGLRLVLPGRGIVAVRLGKTDFIDDPAALGEVLPGKRIARIERIGKFIHLTLAPVAEPALEPGVKSATRSAAEEIAGRSESRINLMVHLGMTGRLSVREASEPAAPHTHGFFELDDGRELRYTDVRRFGRILLVPEPMMAAFRGQLGTDALRISVADFRRQLAKRRARIKALLLDQRVFRGLGNIYADESLWQARIHPARLAARLSDAELAGLRQAIGQVLRAAIRHRGSSISNFVDAEGNAGSYQQRHRAYGREGLPCSRCGTLIRRAIVAGRSSFFCPRCQHAPRAKRARSGKVRRPGARRKISERRNNRPPKNNRARRKTTA